MPIGTLIKLFMENIIEKSIQQKRREYLDSHLKVYLDDPSQRARSTLTGLCMYRTPDGRKCLIGQDLDDDNEIVKYCLNGGVNSSIIFPKLPQFVQELGKQFLEDCQSLHDNNRFWNETGMTELGKDAYYKIIKNHCTE